MAKKYKCVAVTTILPFIVIFCHPGMLYSYMVHTNVMIVLILMWKNCSSVFYLVLCIILIISIVHDHAFNAISLTCIGNVGFRRAMTKDRVIQTPNTRRNITLNRIPLVIFPLLNFVFHPYIIIIVSGESIQIKWKVPNIMCVWGGGGHVLILHQNHPLEVGKEDAGKATSVLGRND